MSSFRERLATAWTRHLSMLGILVLLTWAILLAYAISLAIIGQSQGLPSLQP